MCIKRIRKKGARKLFPTTINYINYGKASIKSTYFCGHDSKRGGGGQSDVPKFALQHGVGGGFNF